MRSGGETSPRWPAPWRAGLLVGAVSAAGTAGTLLVAALTGMDAGELGHLALLLVPAVLATVVAALAARPLLTRVPIGAAMVAVAAVAALAALANLFLLTRLMFVSAHDASLVAILLAHSTAAGVAAAVVLARTASTAVGRLAATARALGEGDLDARAGPTGGGPELAELARALDEMAERLRSAMDRVRDIERRRRDLITAVSHDLRTPLAGLRAMVEAIDDGVVDDPPTLRRYAAEMRGSVQALVTMTEDLFELAQLDAGAIEAEVRRARLEEVIRSAVAACEQQAWTKGLTVEWRLDEAADAACSPRLVRVLQNLLQNAIRHTPADGSVRVEARRLPGELEVAVEDTGEGIAPEALDRVFEPFYRADPARHGTGAGLGLALAKRIVEGLGGRIEASSDPSEGSRFAVTIPETV